MPEGDNQRVHGYEAKTILRRGIAQGAARGKMQTLVHLIAKKWNKNQSVPEIAEALEEEEVRVERIVKLLEEYLAFGVKQLKTAVLRRNTLKNLPFSQNYTPEFCLILPIDFFLLQ